MPHAILLEARRHLEAGRWDLAAQLCRDALCLDPQQADAHHLLGLCAHRLGNTDEAVEHLRRAVDQRPEEAEFHYNLGAVWQLAGDAEAAVSSFREALRLDPGLAEAHAQLAVVLVQQRQLEEAEQHAREAVLIAPAHAAAHNTLGESLRRQGRFEEAAACFNEAIRLQPDYADPYSNLGVVLADGGRPQEAMRHLRTAIRLKPDFAAAYSNHGLLQMLQGRTQEAIASYRHALRIQPDFAEARLNLAFALLLRGEYEEGWREYAWRWQCPSGPTPRKFCQSLWDGTPQPEKTILLHAEQGLGDTLQFIRFLPYVRQRVGRVVLECQRVLLPLLHGFAAADQVVGRGTPLPDFDLHAPLLDLPGLLKTTQDELGAGVPYLAARPELVERWRHELLCRSSASWHVGIAWQGNRTFRWDRYRSIELAEFAPLASLPDMQLVSLQKKAGREQVGQLEQPLPLLDFTDALDRHEAFLDTAALMHCLDLVVTSDTAIAHLAGALGVPVWLALSAAPDWRWLERRENSPWYPTMRIFRQPQLGDWPSVFCQMAESLAEMIRHNDRPLSLKASIVAPDPRAVRGTAPALFGVQADAPLVAAAPPETREPVDSGSHEPSIVELLQEARRKFQAADVDRVEAICRIVLERHADQVDALALLGAARCQRGKYAEAVSCFKRAVGLRREDPELRYNLAVSQQTVGQLSDAVQSYRMLLDMRPDHVEARSNLGQVLSDLGQLDEAAIQLESVLSQQPRYARAHNSLGLVYFRQQRLCEAVEAYERAVQIDPALTRAWHNKAVALTQCARFDAALQSYERALTIDPEFADAHWGRATLLLRQGNFQAGWREYEWRWRLAGKQNPHADLPLWQPGRSASKSVLLHCEEGIGDTLQFVRFARQVQQRGARVILQCPRRLAHLLSSCPGIDEVISEEQPRPACDFQAPLLSLPMLLQVSGTEQVPADVPYLKADPQQVRRWRERLRGRAKLKVGIAWRGRASRPDQERRSFALAQCEPLGAVDQICWVSLQHHSRDVAAEVRSSSLPFTRLTRPLDSGAKAFRDTAAVLECLDLVICCDTSVAHLAAALGRPTWIALAHVADWRWLHDRRDSPWYPTVRLFRQRSAGDWSGVFQEMEQELRRYRT